MKRGILSSAWNNGIKFSTSAELDEETGEVIGEYFYTDDLNLKDKISEIFTDEDGNVHTVCPTCQMFVMREKCIEGEGNGIDYDGQLICSDPYCESNLIL
jgi:hypothetical protein